MNDNMLTREELCKMLKISPSQFDGKIRKSNDFPKEHRLGKRSPRWWKTDVLAWIESKKNNSNQQANNEER